MPARIGIELSSTGCRIVELQRPPRDGAETVVRACVRESAADAVTLARYRRQSAAVVIWGLHGDHRQAVVTVGSYQRMRREAVNATRQAGVDTRQMVADIAPVAAARGAGKRRPVVVALARASEVAAALRSLTAAGVRVRSIVTPALALMSLARMRRRITAEGMAEAYVALEETGTAIALIRGGALVAARELEWGYQDAERIRSRDEMAERLGDAIDEFFGDCGVRPSTVAQLCVCGGLPELRSMTLALMERLDVEVEPLDSLFGIDEDHLPDPADEFRDRIVDMRLAWSVAADWDAPINFLRERRRRLAKKILTRAAVVAGVATGVAVAWKIQQSSLLTSAAPKPAPSAPAPRRAAAARPAPPVPAPIISKPAPPPAPVLPPPPIAAAPVQAPPPKVAPVAAPPPQVVTVAPKVQPPSARVAAPPALPPARLVPPPTPAIVLRPVPAPSPLARTEPVTLPPVRLAPVPIRPTEPARAVPPREAPPAPVVTAPPSLPRPPIRRPPPDEVALPFEASLGTILYGADRKLAIVDGHIVQIGDEVRGARVVDITSNAVLFRDQQGRLRKLALQ
jgi:hypothetical protein